MIRTATEYRESLKNGHEMWSLYDGQQILSEIAPQLAENVEIRIHELPKADPLHVVANTDSRIDRSKPAPEEDTGKLLDMVGETDAGIIVRSSKSETAAGYANQAFTKPTITIRGNDALSACAVGSICGLGSPNFKVICRTELAGAPALGGRSGNDLA